MGPARWIRGHAVGWGQGSKVVVMQYSRKRAAGPRGNDDGARAATRATGGAEAGRTRRRYLPRRGHEEN
jgi:hypothetical protein